MFYTNFLPSRPYTIRGGLGGFWGSENQVMNNVAKHESLDFDNIITRPLTNRKQIFSNSLCIEAHSATIVFPVSTFNEWQNL